MKHAAIEGFPVQPMACITYHETHIKNPLTKRWNKGPIVKRTTIYVVVDGQMITLSTIDKDMT